MPRPVLSLLHAGLISFGLVFLLAPVLLVFPISLSADNFVAWPPSGWSLRWYQQLGRDTEMQAALINSLILAAIVTLGTLVIATPAALVLTRARFRGSALVLSLFTAPLLLPSIVLGLGILVVFVGHGLVGSWPGLILAHLVLTVPYALRVLMTGLAAVPTAVHDAAATLGARPGVVFRRVTLPLITPAVVATAALSFIVSFDEVVISLMVAGTRIKLLPISLYFYVDSRTDPLVAAISAIVVLGTLLLVVVVERSVGVRRAIAK